MTRRSFSLAAALVLVAPGCDVLSSNVLDSVSSSDRSDLERLTGDFFECDAEVRSVTDRATGTLEPGDCLQTDDSYQDFYAFRVSEPARVDLDLVSRDFAPYLFVVRATLGASGRLVEVDRDRNEDRTDRASSALVLDEGVYLVYVNSVDPDEQGDYTLTVNASAEGGEDRPAAQARGAAPGVK